MTDEWVGDAVPALEECAFAIDHVQSFLHGEEQDETADEIRRHLMTCEQCLDYYSVESLITVMVRRCCEHPSASVALRERIACLHVTIS